MSANSGIANSPAVYSLETTFVTRLLAGDEKENIAVAAAVAGVYGIFMFVALFNFFRDKHKAHLLLVFFGAIRVVAFSIRAYMQKHLTENLSIVYEVFFAVGFVALVKLLVSLLMAWTLPHSRELARSNAQRNAQGIIPFRTTLLRSHGSFLERFTFIALIVGVVCSIIGATDAYGDTTSVETYNKGLALMRAGYTIYLVVIVVFVVMCLIQPFFVFSEKGAPTAINRSYKKNFFMASILLVCGLLLTCKSVFQVYAVYVDPSLSFENNLFYPLQVATELLVFLILIIPGVVTMYLRHHAQVPLNNNATYDQGNKNINGETTNPTGVETV